MSSSSDSQFGIALIGLGRAGMIHFGNLVTNIRVKLLYVVEQDTDKAIEKVRQRHLTDTVKVIKPEESQQVFDDERIHGIIVASPTFTHEEIVRKGLKHGKGIFCEKPISQTTEGTIACYRESEITGVPLFCSFNRRYDPNVMDLRKRVLDGEIGDVHVIKTCSRDHPLPPVEFIKLSGGMFHDCAVHDVDLVCWLVQDFPISVYSTAVTHDKEYAALNDVDTVSIVMKFPKGILCNIDLSRHSTYGYDQRIEVLGSKGMLQSTNHAASGIVGYSTAGVSGSQLKHSFPQRYAESYVGALNHFLDVLDGEPLQITGTEFLKVARVVSACEESNRTGQAITLNWD